LRILLTNDDGVHAPGLAAMRQALLDRGHHVTVVAPDREQSATSHSITLDRPLRIALIADGIHAVDGTPTDSVLVGCHGVLRGYPDLVVSGINHGPNMGEDVSYSGTVAAAFEAHILGVASVAVSLLDRHHGDFEGGAGYVAGLIDRLAAWARACSAILNVNLPAGPAGSWGAPVVTRLGTRKYSDEIIEKVDPRGRKYYWIGGAEPEWEGGQDTDFAVVHGGGVSVTPLHLELTDERALEQLTALILSGAEA
jgi:5'-nucleotidase